MSAAALLESLAGLRRQALDEAQRVGSAVELSTLRVRILGRKGELTNVLRGLKDLPPDERVLVGQEANRLKDDLETLLTARESALEDAAEAGAKGLDVTLPGRQPWTGRKHVLNAVEELRDAGAEAIQLDSVRIVADSYFSAAGGSGMIADGKPVKAPYVITAIGDPHTMATAMAIPGGVVDALKQLGATPSVKSANRVDVTALRPTSKPRYAQPSSS